MGDGAAPSAWWRAAGVAALVLIVGGMTALFVPAAGGAPSAAAVSAASCYEDGDSGTVVCDNDGPDGGSTSPTHGGGCCTSPTHSSPSPTHYSPPPTYYDPPTTHYTPPTSVYTPPQDTPPPTAGDFTPATAGNAPPRRQTSPRSAPAPTTDFLPADVTEAAAPAPSFEPTVQLAAAPASGDTDIGSDADPVTPIGSTGGGGTAGQALGAAAVAGGAALGASAIRTRNRPPAPKDGIGGILRAFSDPDPSTVTPRDRLAAAEDAYVRARDRAQQLLGDLPPGGDDIGKYRVAHDEYLRALTEQHDAERAVQRARQALPTDGTTR